jgi:hypothetical protein
MSFDIGKMTPTQLKERKEALERKLAARVDRTGKAMDGFGPNVEAIKRELSEIEKLK